MPRGRPTARMSTVVRKHPETEAEKLAKQAYRAAEAEWLAASRAEAQDNTIMAELSVRKLGLYTIWKEERAKAAIA
jgi:hypothetical protein